MVIYYNKKDNFYIPETWSTEIKNGKLIYFIYGKGYVKTSMKFMEKLEVNINQPKNYSEAWKIYSKYGKDVLNEAIENNSSIWKDNYCWLVSGGEKACKLYDEFFIFFKKDIMFFLGRLHCLGIFDFDIIKFEHYIIGKYGYDGRLLISLKDFIKITHGEKAVICIENLIGFYDYIQSN